MEKKLRYGHYLWKTMKWLIGNAVFGLFPLLFMYAVYIASDKTVCGQEVDNLIHEGTVIFVSLAIVGAVLVDYWLSGFRPIGFTRFATYFFPAFILFIVLINYLLINLNKITHDRFALGSGTTIVVVMLSVLYVIFVKTSLYMREDNRHERNI